VLGEENNSRTVHPDLEDDPTQSGDSSWSRDCKQEDADADCAPTGTHHDALGCMKAKDIDISKCPNLASGSY